MNEPWYLPVTAVLAALDTGRLRSADLVAALLDRIATLDPGLGAVVALRADEALAEARRMDDERANGQRRGPLHGVPVTIKDSLEVAGLPTVCGAPALRDYFPAADAVSVRRLRDAGALVLGKTNVPLYAADLQTFNAVFGRTSNPHALDRTSGGSSGGAAAALAAGFTPAELGSDLCGSLRLPAHYCGVSSLKPSYGLVPLAGLLSGPPGRHHDGDLSVVGPMARTVADLELLFSVLSGPADQDARAWRLELPPPPARALRIAVWLDEPFCPPDTVVRSLLVGVAEALAQAGHRVGFGSKPAIDAAAMFADHCRLMWADMSAGVPADTFDYFARRAARRNDKSAPRPGEGTDALAAGLTIGHREWLRVKERQAELRQRWDAFFSEWDVLLCPAAPTVAPPHDERRLEQRFHPIDGRPVPALRHGFWATLASIACLPAVTVPAGVDAVSGLPAGAQIIGPYLGDRTALHAASLVEELSGGFRPPALVAGHWRERAPAV